MKMTMSIVWFLVAAVATPPAHSSQALSPQDRQYSVLINNSCHRDISVAVHYRHPERGWITEGWWQVAGNSELDTGITASHNQFYLFGDTEGYLQWPPERSRKDYPRYGILEGDFVLEEGASAPGMQEAPFSLKEVSPQSAGLKARFDC